MEKLDHLRFGTFIAIPVSILLYRAGYEIFLGAVLVKGDMGIVACDLPTEGHETSDIVDVLAMMENWGAYPRRIPRNSLFPQLVREGPGFKIFAKRMSGDLTLFVMMRSAGYIGPATQDIKETIERIKGEMDVTSSE